MPYFTENDDLRLEIRDAVAATISHYPKVNGENVLTTGTPTFEVFDPSGSSIDSGTATAALVGDVHRLDASIAAIGTRDENYQIRFSYTPSGQPAEVDVILFDVVAWPLDSSVSLNDLLEERPDVGEVLDRLGVLLGFTTGDALGQAQPEMAGVFSRRALVELDALLRDQVYADQQRLAHDFKSFRDNTRRQYIRPNLILNRERLNRVLRKLAMKLVYAADMAAPDSGDESAGLFAYYEAEARMSWSSIGPLQYDFGDDLLPDDELTSISKAVTLRRVQA